MKLKRVYPPKESPTPSSSLPRTWSDPSKKDVSGIDEKKTLSVRQEYWTGVIICRYCSFGDPLANKQS